MPRVRTLVLGVASMLVVTACAPMFEFNLFAGIDNPPAPSAADYTGAEGLDALAEDLDSPAVVEALAATPGLVQEILDSLDDYFTDGDGVAGDTDGQAAILYADLALKTTEGENFVDNIVDALLDGSLVTASNIGALIRSIVPPEALASEETFTDMVAALLAVNDAYEALGTYVDGDDDGSATNPLPPGTAPGDIVQKAVVAYTMRFLVDTVIADLPAADEAAASVQLFLEGTENTTDPRYDAAGWAAMSDVTPIGSPPNWLQALMGLAPLP